ncbi:MAG TPA: FCD domain-containing protein, partial [Nonomuraea sp.]|nr:FCD domain-containing protein [Nonomuraea sp.]
HAAAPDQAAALRAALRDPVSGPPLRERVRPGQTVAEHEAIYNALAAGDATLAQAAALMHIGTTENWLRSVLGDVEGSRGHDGNEDEETR